MNYYLSSFLSFDLKRFVTFYQSSTIDDFTINSNVNPPTLTMPMNSSNSKYSIFSMIVMIVDIICEIGVVMFMRWRVFSFVNWGIVIVIG